MCRELMDVAKRLARGVFGRMDCAGSWNGKLDRGVAARYRGETICIMSGVIADLQVPSL